VVLPELAKNNARAARDRDAAAKAPANKGGKVGGVPMGPWSLKAVDKKSVSQLLTDPGVTARAAAQTHMAWLSGGNKPGVRLVKDDPIVSMQKAGLDVTGLEPKDAGARLAALGLEIGPKHRTFAFAVDASRTPMPKNAAEAKVLDVLGRDAVKKQITDNNLPAIQGVAGGGRALAVPGRAGRQEQRQGRPRRRRPAHAGRRGLPGRAPGCRRRRHQGHRPQAPSSARHRGNGARPVHRLPKGEGHLHGRRTGRPVREAHRERRRARPRPGARAAAIGQRLHGDPGLRQPSSSSRTRPA